MKHTYSVVLLHGKENVPLEIARGQDGWEMQAMCEQFGYYMADNISEIRMLDLHTGQTLYLWRADFAGWLGTAWFPN